jgi:folylpolyglutamate synthase
MIELSLARVSRLVQQSTLSWKAVHVAGTNGKGSITSYVSGLLAAAGVRTGRFTSPHLIDRWDCIAVGEKVVKESLFLQIEGEVKQRDQRLGIGATEFELLTAIAFEIFHRERVEVGVVEVGMGGRLDATNILSDVLVSVISKIGLDHESFLGNSLQAIAREKAGILKKGTPCVVDGTNNEEALRVIRARSQELTIDATITDPQTVGQRIPKLARIFEELQLEPHQRANMTCAVLAAQKALAAIRPENNIDDLLPILSQICWPGRLQEITVRPLVSREEPVLIDGAHNSQSADVLGKYVDRKLRPSGRAITWTIAMSHGKNMSDILKPLIQPGDNVAVVAFGPVDGMPWVEAIDTSQLAEHIQSFRGVAEVKTFGSDIPRSMRWASEVAKGGPWVMAGSLYLVSDVFRLLREKQIA